MSKISLWCKFFYNVFAISDETDGNNLGVAALQTYMNTHMFLNNYAAQYRDLAQAAGLKKFRFECQKAINIPVNGISGINGMHLKDKYETLRSLIMGKSSFNITQHPQGIPFCKDILAKKIVVSLKFGIHQFWQFFYFL